jgi:hypothetical protein
MLSSVIFFVKSLLQYLNRFSFLVCQKVIVLVIDVRSPNSKTHLNMTKKSYMPMPTFRKTERLLEIIKVCDFFFEKLKLSIKWYNIYKLYKFSFASYRTNFGWAHPFSKIKKCYFKVLKIWNNSPMYIYLHILVQKISRQNRTMCGLKKEKIVFLWRVESNHCSVILAFCHFRAGHVQSYFFLKFERASIKIVCARKIVFPYFWTFK